MATPDYSGSTWYGAYSGNYSDASRPPTISRVIIHMTQGSWSSALNWFRDSRAGVSAHYTVRSSDGAIGQSVQEQDIAYHAGNWSYNQTSVGIEHEGYVSDPKWFTESMYRSSARLTAYLCKKYGIPVDRAHIIGHNEVPGATHTDPGGYWNWTKYISYVKEAAGGTAATTANRDPLPDSGGSYNQVVGDLSTSRFKMTGSWTESTFHSDTNYGGTHRAYTKPSPTSRDKASFKVKTPRTGEYKVYAWWPADPGYNSRARYRILTSGGWVTKTVNQRTNGKQWVGLGAHRLDAGDSFKIEVLGKSSESGFVIADAVGIVER